MNRKTGLALFIALAVVVAVVAVGNRYIQDLNKVALPPGTSLGSGDMSDTSKAELAPDFQLQTLDGATVSLKNFRGKPVVLNFWATW